MTILTQNKQYASRSGEFYKEQRDKNIRNYKCPFDNCNAAFYNKSLLTGHLLKHTGKRPYGCNHCSYKARQKFLVDKHKLKSHNIPLPSTRTSRYRERASLPPQFRCLRLAQYTGNKVNHYSTKIQHRIQLYKQNPMNILSLVEKGFITKKEFSADKGRGYIDDAWFIFQIANRDRQPKISRSLFKARSHSKKLTNMLNQIHTLHILYPSLILRENQMNLLRNDNKSKSDLITKAIQLYNKEFK